MKKIILPITIAALAFASCGNDNGTPKAEDQKVTDTKENVEVKTPETTVSASEVPNFSNPEVKKLAEDYTAFVKDYTAAAKSNDAAKLQELSIQAQEWAAKAADASKSLQMSPEDTKLWGEYMAQLSQQLVPQQ